MRDGDSLKRRFSHSLPDGFGRPVWFFTRPPILMESGIAYPPRISCTIIQGNACPFLSGDALPCADFHTSSPPSFTSSWDLFWA
jgi:hypothetical protein